MDNITDIDVVLGILNGICAYLIDEDRHAMAQSIQNVAEYLKSTNYNLQR